jgi:membrane fusion protein, multidrug efflux system
MSGEVSLSIWPCKRGTLSASMRPVDSKTLISGIVSIAIVTGGALGLGGCQGADAKAGASKDASDRVVPVVVVPVVRRDMPIYLEGLGNVLASATVTVHTLVDGRIDKIAFREGQEVKKGDLLAQIDPRPFQNQLNTANAAMVRDQAQLAGAVRNLERYTELAKNGLNSQQSVDDQAVLVAQLKATVNSDQAAIDSAKLSLDYARISTPIDGVTGIRLVDQGNIVHAADPGGIVVLTTLDPIAVIFTLPQDNLAAIAKELSEGTVGVDAMSRDGGTKLASGKLALIDNQINQTTATIRLKAMFDNPNHVLWPNAFVKTRLLLSTDKNALVIPTAVVQQGPQGPFAYVVDADQKAQVHLIQIAASQGDSTVVTSGIQAGDQVVLDGYNQLKPGSKVTTRAPDAAGSKDAPKDAPKDDSGKGGKAGKEGKGAAKPAASGGKQ